MPIMYMTALYVTTMYLTAVHMTDCNIHNCSGHGYKDESKYCKDQKVCEETKWFLAF